MVTSVPRRPPTRSTAWFSRNWRSCHFRFPRVPPVPKAATIGVKATFIPALRFRYKLRLLPQLAQELDRAGIVLVGERCQSAGSEDCDRAQELGQLTGCPGIEATIG